MRIGIDIDGVLANFFTGYENVTIRTTGKDLFEENKYANGYFPHIWNWPEALGYTTKEMNAVWDEIKDDYFFWEDLDALPGAGEFIKFLEEAHENDFIYYITDRPGLMPHKQSQAWLSNHHAHKPNVIISSHKGPTKGDICKGLQVDYYLDDKGENILDCLKKSPKTKAYLLAYPYNDHTREEIIKLGGKVIFNREDFLSEL